MFKDPILKKLHKQYGPHQFEDKSEKLYEELVESIIGQQLSGKAADTIFKRFLALYKDSKFPKPEELLKTDDEKLRSAGMRYSKVSYIKNIAKAFKNGDLDSKTLRKMNDEDVKKELTKIKGVGNWTAEMTLIFTLKRKDVFSLGDAGLRRTIKNLYKIEKEKDILKLSETWRPKRSYACWYLWQSLDNAPKI